MRITPLVASFLALTLVGAGCQFGSSTAVETGGSGSSAPVASEGGCGNGYFPSRVGTKVVYASTASGSRTTYSSELTAHVGTRYTLVYTFERGLTVTQNMVCDGGELRAEGYLDLSSALSGGTITTRTTKVEGVFMPADLAVGSSWEATYEVQAQFNIPGAPVGLSDVRMTIHSERRAVAEEDVTVAGRTYRALKVEATEEVPAVTFGAVTLPERTVHTTEYYVRGIGLVKMTGDFGVTEATEITVP